MLDIKLKYYPKKLNIWDYNESANLPTICSHKAVKDHPARLGVMLVRTSNPLAAASI
jgi:hypothetical protein